MSKRILAIFLLCVFTSALTAAAVFAAGYGILKHKGYIYKQDVNNILSSGKEGNSTVVSTVKKINPAVVSITVTKNLPIIERYFRSPRTLCDFFGGDDFMFPQYRVRGTQRVEVGGGSGFFVSDNGYIVTNRHVVDDSEAEYTVLTNDGQTHEAEVVAVDSSLDIAVLKVSGSSYPYLSFGNSDQLEVGQTVIAIGNALGEFRNTVSVGVVSGLGRSITAGDALGRSETLEELIQTDAAINPGNSGGPLLDIEGNVIGVNVAVASDAQSVGFALPANSVQNVLKTIIESNN